jgi:hypothetical protein
MRPPWKPIPEELDSFCDVYIDESGHSAHRYFILGALIIPYTHRDLFDADILAARDGTGEPKHKGDQYKVMKWTKVNRENLQAYKNTVDATLAFKRKHNMSSLKDMRINCLAVDTSARPLHKTGKGDRETAYEIELYFLTGVCVAGRFRDSLLRLHTDRKFFRKKLNELRKMMNSGALKHGHRKQWPFRHFGFGDPETSLPLQVVDIFIGALGFKLNRHYDTANPTSPKKQLCDYIWQKLKLGDPFKIEPRPHKYFFNWMHRPGIEGYKTKFYQNEPFEE